MKALIFDLDGTLLNSLEEIALTMNKILKEYSYKEYEIKEYKDFVGDGPLTLVRNILPKDTKEEKIKLMVQGFKDAFDTELKHASKPYEGVENLLKKLQNLPLKLAILSNKPHELTCAYTKELFAAYNFLEVHGQKQNIPKKPHPKGAICIAKRLNIACEDIYFIGDTPTDIKTAQAAKMKSIAVTWGFRKEEELKEAGADYLVQNCDELYELIKLRIKTA